MQTQTPRVVEARVAERLFKFGIVCPDAKTLKRASAIVQGCSGRTFTADDKRLFAHAVRKLLKKLDKEAGWPFEYIRQYPRSPFELSDQILDHACGKGVRPVPPPGVFEGSKFNVMVCTTPYKKQRLNKTPRLHQTPAEGAIVPSPSPAVAASSGLGGGPSAAMVNAFMQEGIEQYGYPMMPPRRAIPTSFDHRGSPPLEVWTVQTQLISRIHPF